MINTFLPSNLSTDFKIDKIYTDLSQKIKRQLGDSKISCKYNGISVLLNTQETIKDFLLAKDFYNYQFDSASGFLGDLIGLQGNISIKSILTGKTNSPSALAFRSKYEREKYGNYYSDLQQHYSSLTISAFKKKKLGGSFSGFEEHNLIEKAFDYKQLTQPDRHEILTIMDVPVCPYCNVNYTSSYETKNERRTTADLDHFYIKSQHPEYGLCLYNFVPSCPVCNSRLKGTKAMARETQIFPHEDSFNGKAKFEIVNLIEALIHKKERLQLKLVNYKKDEKIESSVEIFKINERYDFHKEFASEILENAIAYNESYANELQRQKNIFDKKLDVKQLIFGPDLPEEMYARRSLGKLRMDLLHQLGVLKKEV